MAEKQRVMIEVVDGRVESVRTLLPDGVAPEVVIVDHDNRIIERSSGNAITNSGIARHLNSLKAMECDCGMDCGAHGYKEVER